jgi:hypothetical protein
VTLTLSGESTRNSLKLPNSFSLLLWTAFSYLQNRAKDKLMFELSAALTDTNFVFELMEKERETN